MLIFVNLPILNLITKIKWNYNYKKLTLDFQIYLFY